MNTTAIETNGMTGNETAAHVAAAKAKLALIAAKQDAKEAQEKLTAEKEAAKKAKIEAANKLEIANAERTARLEGVKQEIAALNEERARIVDSANKEHARKLADLLAARGLTADDIDNKPRANRESVSTFALPTAWTKGDGIDANGYVVPADSANAIYVVGQKGRHPLALHAARDAAFARQNAV
jgi:hypothetical protein